MSEQQTVKRGRGRPPGSVKPPDQRKDRMVRARVPLHLKEWAECQEEGESEFIRRLLEKTYRESLIV